MPCSVSNEQEDSSVCLQWPYTVHTATCRSPPPISLVPNACHPMHFTSRTTKDIQYATRQCKPNRFGRMQLWHAPQVYIDQIVFKKLWGSYVWNEVLAQPKDTIVFKVYTASQVLLPQTWNRCETLDVLNSHCLSTLELQFLVIHCNPGVANMFSQSLIWNDKLKGEQTDYQGITTFNIWRLLHHECLIGSAFFSRLLSIEPGWSLQVDMENEALGVGDPWAECWKKCAW